MLQQLIILLVASITLLHLLILSTASQKYNARKPRFCNDSILHSLTWNDNESTVVLPQYMGIHDTMFNSDDIRWIRDHQRRDTAFEA